MNKKLLLSLSGLVLLLSLSSCRQEGNGGSSPAEETSVSGQSEEFRLTKEQFNTSEMRIGDPLQVQFTQEVSATAYIRPAPSGKAGISPPISGRVKQIFRQTGERVNAGTTLFTLESQELILIQQEYGMEAHRLGYLAADYERLKTLTENDISSRKDLQRAESEYLSTKVAVEALRIRLEYLGIPPAEVGKGHIAALIEVKAPISGIISRQELNIGQFVEPGESLMEIIDPAKLQLELNVFERSLDLLAPGQQVVFFIPDRPENNYHATLSRIGTSVDPESRTARCIASLDRGQAGFFLENMYVESTIYTCERETRALPEDALLREDGQDYALVLSTEDEQGYAFRKVPLKTGPTQNGLTEVLDAGLKDVLLEGAYMLWMEN